MLKINPTHACGNPKWLARLAVRVQPGPALSRPRHSLGIDVLGEMPMRVVARFPLVREPAISPDLRRAQRLLPSAQDDADRLVVENQREAGH